MKNWKRAILLSVLLISCISAINSQRRPVIGISDTHRDGTNAAVPRSYVNAVLLTGGIPVVIPLMEDDEEMIELLNSLDGIIFTGGEDFDPAFYNERPIPQMGRINAPRDKFDLKLVRLAAERNVPILGICRGIQLINIAFGGSLYQDLPVQYYDKTVRHRQSQSSEEASHSVIVEDFTIFSDIVKEQMLMVNSAHHQAVKEVAKGFRVAGKSSDKIVEVIEKIDNENWILGVQFHPEMRVTRDVAMRRIFQRFIEEAVNKQNPNRPDRTLTASRTQIERDPLLSNNNTLSASVPEIIYKNVIDTQYIYRIVHDTLYVSIPADTIYYPVYDTVYIAANTSITPETVSSSNVRISVDTIYYPVYDTVYIAANTPETVTSSDLVYTSSNIVNQTLQTVTTTSSNPSNISNTSESVNIQYESNKISNNQANSPVEVVYKSSTPVTISTNTFTIPSDSVAIPDSDTNINESISVNDVISDSTVTDTGLRPAQVNDFSENRLILFEPDTLIFTPGDVTVATSAKKSAVSKSNSKREEKEKKKKEKYEKQLAKAQERQFQQQQKENAKLDKKELKLRKKEGTAETE